MRQVSILQDGRGELSGGGQQYEVGDGMRWVAMLREGRWQHCNMAVLHCIAKWVVCKKAGGVAWRNRWYVRRRVVLS